MWCLGYSCVQNPVTFSYDLGIICALGVHVTFHYSFGIKWCHRYSCSQNHVTFQLQF